MNMREESALKNLVRVGTVSSVDVEKRLVRVEYADKQDVDGKPLISGPLKVLQNQPLVTIEKWVEELGEENKYDYETAYNSHPRALGLGESYVQKPYAELKDVIKNEKIIKYEKRETIDENAPLMCVDEPPGHIPPPPHPITCNICGAPAQKCQIHGVIEHKKHRQTVTVYPWLPYVGQLVVCIYLPHRESDGFVMGGI